MLSKVDGFRWELSESSCVSKVDGFRGGVISLDSVVVCCSDSAASCLIFCTCSSLR